MVEFKDRLKKLMEDKNINAEQLSKYLHEKITSNTIRNYIKGNCLPKSIENIQILADFLGVSTDYLQGLTDEPTININIKNICNEYGLTEKSLSNLREVAEFENKTMGRKLKRFGISKTDSLNRIIEDKDIIELIDNYLNSYVNSNYCIGLLPHGELQLYDKRKCRRMMGYAFIEGEEIEELILLLIVKKLRQIKDDKKKVKNNERSRNNKK